MVHFRGKTVKSSEVKPWKDLPAILSPRFVTRGSPHAPESHASIGEESKEMSELEGLIRSVVPATCFFLQPHPTIEAPRNTSYIK